MSIAEKLYAALVKKYEAQISEAEAEILIYLTNPVGIGEHPQHIEEIDKFVENLANAKDKLETIQALINFNRTENN